MYDAVSIRDMARTWLRTTRQRWAGEPHRTAARRIATCTCIWAPLDGTSKLTRHACAFSPGPAHILPGRRCGLLLGHGRIAATAVHLRLRPVDTRVCQEGGDSRRGDS